MGLGKGLQIKDLSLYVEELDSLVFGDLHIGYEEALNNAGIMIPRFQFKDIMERLGRILLEFKEKKLSSIILNGDLKHDFGTISSQEWREILKIIDFLQKYCKKVIVIQGNHDIILAPIAGKRNIEIVENYFSKGYYITHGHLLPSIDLKQIKTIIIGNEHAAITLSDSVKHEKYKCFLKGKWKRKNIIVMPSFHGMTIGTNVLERQFLSPYLHQNIDDFEVFIVEDRVYDFGKVKNL